MGLVFLYQARYGAAINSMQDAVKSLRDAGHHNRDLAEFMADLADALAQAGRGNESERLLVEPLDLSRRLKNSALEASVLNVQGNVRFYADDLRGARASYTLALRAASAQTSDKSSVLISKLNLDRLSIAEGHPQATVRDLRTITQQAAGMGLQYLALDSSVTLGQALVDSKDHAQARTQLESALDKSERLGARAQSARIHYLLASAMHASSGSEAESQYKQAVVMLDDLRKEDGAAHLLDRSDLRVTYADATHWSTVGTAFAHN
jgi:tetratricopeptide (TPR) repeat protein